VRGNSRDCPLKSPNLGIFGTVLNSPELNKFQFILERRIKMKFVKGMIIGTAIAAGMAIMYNEGMMNKKTIMKKGRQLAKKIGAF
jgi:hypothetical protein